MRPRRSRRVTLLTGVMVWLLAGVAPSQALESTPRVYRCGDSYGTTPCPGGKPVAVDDSRSDDQRRQALAAKAKDAQLARELAAERQARERAAIGQQAARLGPSDAERARAEALANRGKAKAGQDGKKKPRRPPRAPKSA